MIVLRKSHVIFELYAKLVNFLNEISSFLEITAER